MIETANISVSVVCLIVAIICWFSKAWPKAQLVLFMLAGAGMGALGGVIAVDESHIWPAVDPQDPEYLLDLKTTLEGSHGGHGGHHSH